MTATIINLGNSRGIKLPEMFLEALDLKDNDAVDLIAYNGKIIIKKICRRKSLKQRVEEFYGKDFDIILKENPCEFEETDWGQPVGGEIW